MVAHGATGPRDADSDADDARRTRRDRRGDALGRAERNPLVDASGGTAPDGTAETAARYRARDMGAGGRLWEAAAGTTRSAPWNATATTMVRRPTAERW